MKRVKLIWLAVMAAFALTAVAVTATSASAAEPEWGHCVSVKSKGHYEDSNCTKEDFKENKAHVKKYKGKFEWLPGAAAACFAQKHGKYKDAACTEEDLKKGATQGQIRKDRRPQIHRRRRRGHAENGAIRVRRRRRRNAPPSPAREVHRSRNRIRGVSRPGSGMR